MGLEHDSQIEARRLAECIEKDPARLGGEPVFRGTRVPVKSLFDHLKVGIRWRFSWMISGCHARAS